MLTTTYEWFIVESNVSWRPPASSRLGGCLLVSVERAQEGRRRREPSVDAWAEVTGGVTLAFKAYRGEGYHLSAIARFGGFRGI